VPRSFAFRKKAVALRATCWATAEEWSAVNSKFEYGGQKHTIKAGAKIEIEKYSIWNENKAVQIGFTKVALGKFIDKNDEVMYFTRKHVRRIILAYKCNSSGPCVHPVRKCSKWSKADQSQSRFGTVQVNSSP